MSRAPPPPSREKILDAFAVEPNPGRETLERYIRDYPAYAAELAELSRELCREMHQDEGPLSARDQALVEAAWRQHAGGAAKVVADPFAVLSVTQLREIAKQLDVPRQVIAAFRERRVIVSSVPRQFLARLAAAVNSTIDLVVSALVLPPGPTLARSHKSADKPTTDTAVTFERLLIDAGVPEEKRERLLADSD